jgi:quercetin dioxygenase-like cupin family protein
MKISTAQAKSSRKGPSDWFTGTVWIDEIVSAPPPARVKANRVTFEPGARTAWHTHPVGQTLHVEAGVGRVQLKGNPVCTIYPGDTVWIAPGEEHWHGADAAHTFTHLAIQERDEHGAEVVWLDHVSDAEYEAEAGI